MHYQYRIARPVNCSSLTKKPSRRASPFSSLSIPLNPSSHSLNSLSFIFRSLIFISKQRRHSAFTLSLSSLSSLEKEKIPNNEPTNETKNTNNILPHNQPAAKLTICSIARGCNGSPQNKPLIQPK